LTQSNCNAEGAVSFADGDRGQWRRSPFRDDTLPLQDGRMIYLHCPRCRAPVFDEPDDPAMDDRTAPRRARPSPWPFFGAGRG